MPNNPELNVNETLVFESASVQAEDIPVEFREPGEDDNGFNEHGVRENYEDNELQSVDVMYRAMEPGPPRDRNGVRITKSFLRNLGGKDYSNPPFLKDHDRRDTFAKIGSVKEVQFRDALWVMNRIPNVQGSQNHEEAIARFTHDPPQITDGSVGLGQDYTVTKNDEGEPELQDARLQEFSTTNFPGGYDDGGLEAAFAEAIEEVSVLDVDDEDVSDEPDDGEFSETSASQASDTPNESSNSLTITTKTVDFN